MNIEFNKRSLDKLQRQLKELIKKDKKAAFKGMKVTGYQIHAEAVNTITRNRSVDTGRLRSSLSVNWTGSGIAHGKVESPAKADDGVREPEDKVLAVVIGTNVEYAARVEFGYTGPDSLGRTFNQQPRPYLRPAFASKIGNLIKNIKKEMPK